MPQITQIQPQKRRNDRFNIYIDGQFGFGVSAQNLVKFKLKVGQKISSPKAKEIVLDDNYKTIYEKALNYLSYRPRSEKEIRNYLKKKIRNLKKSPFCQFKKGLIDKVITSLKKQELINDRRFVSWWLKQRSQHRPRGKKMLLAELWQKGIPTKLAKQLIEKKVDEQRLVDKLIPQIVKKYQKLPLIKRRQKLIGYLSRRGFSWPVIKKAIDCLD